MRLNLNEVNNKKELNKQLKDYIDIKNYEVAVIAFIFNKENKIIFQRRGQECRDERLKLENIGGRVKESDIDFRTALKREITEEVGDKADIEINEFITSTYAKTFDNRYNKEQNWIFLAYKGILKKGNLEIKEPTKCLGYETYKIGEVDEKELSNGARELYKIVCEKYK